MLAVFSIGIACADCTHPPEEVSLARLKMGTVVEITALGQDRESLQGAVEAAFDEIERAESLMSSFREGSDVDRLNRSAGGPPVAVDPEVYWILERSVGISAQSGGAFDVTVAGLRGVWSIDPEHPRIPAPAEIEQRLPLVGFRNMVLEKGYKAGLLKPGMRVDLGGIAKGYAVDRAIETLMKHGVTMAMVNAGGDLRTLGKHGGRPWMVGIQDPRNKGEILGKFPVADMAVATSGDYEKFIEQGGKRYCHIIDPRSGRPAAKVRSVTVIAREAWLADAMATALFVLGPEGGMTLVEKTPGLEAMMIDLEGRILETKGMKGRVEWLER